MRARRRPLPAMRSADAERVQVAASLQQTCGQWLIMWSPWRRTYTGFARFTREPVIVDEATADDFLARIKQIELAAASR